jgi:hypothetical protein
MVWEVIGKDGGDIPDELVLAVNSTSGRPSSALEVKREGPFSKSQSKFRLISGALKDGSRN